MATGFQALMMMAKANTEASQAALAEEVRQREARERKRREEEDRKEVERKRREKERLEKARVQEAAREAKLQQERQERVKRRQEEAAAAKATTASTPNSSKPRTSSQSGSRFSKAPKMTTSVQMNSEEQRAFDRQQKAARARARLFDEDPPKRSAIAAGIKRNGPNGSTGTARLSSKGKGRISGNPSNTPGSASASLSKGLSARARIAAEFNNGAAQFTALNQVKRDRRTIEEVERDMRIRKGEAVAGLDDMFGDPRTKKLDRDPPKTEARGSSTRSLQISTQGRPSVRAAGCSAPGRLGIPESTRVSVTPSRAPDLKRKLSTTTQGSPTKKPKVTACQTDQRRNVGVKGGPGAVAQRSPMDEGEEEEDESDGDFVEDDVGADMRDQIWQIMGKDRRQYASQAAYSDEESEDMEAGVRDVLEEEGRAARLARQEDLREQEALKRHEIEKRRRLATAGR